MNSKIVLQKKNLKRRNPKQSSKKSIKNQRRFKEEEWKVKQKWTLS
jgi:hypothetical protein